jgi:hypothetical protein
MPEANYALQTGIVGIIGLWPLISAAAILSRIALILFLSAFAKSQPFISHCLIIKRRRQL